MIGINAVTREGFVVGGEQGARARLGRVLRGINDLEEGVDIYQLASA